MPHKKTLIVYGSNKGTTRDMVYEIAKRLDKPSEFFDCKNCSLQLGNNGKIMKLEQINLSNYGLILIGTPMYMGAPLKAVKQFCIQNEAELYSHELGIFTCGVGTQEEDRAYIRKHIPETLIGKAYYSHLGGEIRENKMNLLERAAMRGFIKQRGSVTGVNHDSLNKLCSFANLNTM